jgi:hypothetical protein
MSLGVSHRRDGLQNAEYGGVEIAMLSSDSPTVERPEPREIVSFVRCVLDAVRQKCACQPFR